MMGQRAPLIRKPGQNA